MVKQSLLPLPLTPSSCVAKICLSPSHRLPLWNQWYFFPIPWLLCLNNGSLLTEARLALNWYGWQWPSNLPASTCCMPGLQHINTPGLCGAGIKLRPSSTLVKFSTNKATPPPQFHICKGPITMAVVGVHFTHKCHTAEESSLLILPEATDTSMNDIIPIIKDFKNLHQAWLRRGRWHRKMKSQMSKQQAENSSVFRALKSLLRGQEDSFVYKHLLVK